LAVPRAEVAVGDLYLETDGNLTSAGNVQRLLSPPLALPALRKAEVMADVGGQLSRGVDAKFGLALLEHAVAAFAGPALAGNVRTSYDAKRTQQIRFRFQDTTRDSIDMLEFGASLTGHRLIEAHPLISEATRFYIVTAVARTASICVSALGERGQALEIDVQAASVLAASSGLAVAALATSEVKYSGSEQLAFGVELHELAYDRERSAFKLSVPTQPMLVRSAHPNPETANAIDSSRPAAIGGVTGDIMILVRD
jgi:hypothetical protein